MKQFVKLDRELTKYDVGKKVITLDGKQGYISDVSGDKLRTYSVRVKFDDGYTLNYMLSGKCYTHITGHPNDIVEIEEEIMTEFKIEIGKKYVCRNAPNIKYVEVISIANNQRSYVTELQFHDGLRTVVNHYSNGRYLGDEENMWDLIAEYVEPETTLKIGDKVKIISNTTGLGDKTKIYVGESGTITRIDINEPYPYIVDITVYRCLARRFRACDLELIKDEPAPGTVTPGILIEERVTLVPALYKILADNNAIAMRADGKQFMAKNKQGEVCWYVFDTINHRWVNAWWVKVSDHNTKYNFKLLDRNEFFKNGGK